MKATSFCCAAVLLGCLVGATGRSDAAEPFGGNLQRQPSAAGGHVVVPVSAAYYGRPYHRASWYRHASTPAESLARGAAALLRARAEFCLLTAQARITAAEAYRREIENRKLATAACFELRERNRSGRAAEHGPRPTQEQLVRYAQGGKPERLSPSELDTATGEVSWPVLLQDEVFSVYRAELETLFARGVRAGEDAARQYSQVRQATGAMLARLKHLVHEVPPMDYSQARRFIQSLAYEARQASAGVDG